MKGTLKHSEGQGLCLMLIDFTRENFVILIFFIVVETVMLFFILVSLYNKHQDEKNAIFSGKDALVKKDFTHLTQSIEELKDQLEERNYFINAIFSNMKDGILVLGMNDEIIFINQLSIQYLKITEEELSKNFFSEKSIFQEILRNNKKMFQLEVGKKDVLEISKTAICDKKRKNIVYGKLITIKNISKIKEAETLRKQFVANVSHEFRTPITLISGFTETLKLWDELEKEERERALDIIGLETDRLKRLVSDLFLLSEIENNISGYKTDLIDIDGILKRIVQSYQVIADKKQIKINLYNNVVMPVLQGNENWFYQCVCNLVDNAIKYNRNNGEVDILCFIQDDHIIVEVKDKGYGIIKENIPFVFERFYRSDASRNSKTGGSGIGLSIVKRIMNVFGGRVEVQSVLNEGSVFKLIFNIEKRNNSNI